MRSIERMFTPLGLDSTVFSPEAAITDPAAGGYTPKRHGGPFPSPVPIRSRPA